MAILLSNLSQSDIEMVGKFNQVIESLVAGKWAVNNEHENNINQFSRSTYKHSASRFFYLDGHGGTCSVRLSCKPTKSTELYSMILSTSGVVSQSGRYMTEIGVDRLKSMSVGAIVALIEVEIAALMKPSAAIEVNPYDMGELVLVNRKAVNEVDMITVGCNHKNNSAVSDIKIRGFDGTISDTICFSYKYKGKPENMTAKMSRYIHLLESHQKQQQAA